MGCLATASRLTPDQRIRLEIIEGYGGCCSCCGTTHLPHLTIDHVENDGAAARARGEKARHLYYRLRREDFPPGYQILCFNCNAAKYLEGGRCSCREPSPTSADLLKRHPYRGRGRSGEAHGGAKLRAFDVVTMRAMRAHGATYTALGQWFDVSGTAARDVCTRTWQTVPGLG